MNLSNRFLIRCCYTGMFVQALVINLPPLLFIPLREQLGLSYEQLGRLVLVNFLVQLSVDVFCARFHRSLRAKPLLFAANFLAALGMWIFASSVLFSSLPPYALLMIGTILFSAGCGLLEVLLSPIINIVSTERKSENMAILHAFYPMGKLAVILATAGALQFFGMTSWPWIFAAWSLLPLGNSILFCMAKVPDLAGDTSGPGMRTLLASASFRRFLWLMVLAGATEVALGQWTSAYLQEGLGLPKAVADFGGFGLFAAGMIVGRLRAGFQSKELLLRRTLLRSGIASTVVCLVLALSPLPWLAVLACGPAGYMVSMLWPGTISLAAARFPLAGAGMFALLAAAGDSGAALLPWLTGWVADVSTAVLQTRQWSLPLPGEPGLRIAFFLMALSPLALALLVRNTQDHPRA